MRYAPQLTDAPALCRIDGHPIARFIVLRALGCAHLRAGMHRTLRFMTNFPLLSVFIPTYNGERYVREAIESVLDNGIADLEVVIVDDASTDATVAVIESIRHPAIRLARNPHNVGVVATRRAGVPLLQGRYVALLDQDDIAVPGRFQAQLARMETAGGPDILGGMVESFGLFEGVSPCYASNAEIRSVLLFNAPMAHPAVCMNVAPLREGVIAYSLEAGPAADYALWVDAMFAGLRMENLDRVVTRYRRHAGSMTYTHIDDMLACACRVRKRVVDAYFPAFSDAERVALVNAIAGGFDSEEQWRGAIYALSRAALAAPHIPGIDSALMARLLAEHVMRSIKVAVKRGHASCDTLEMMAEESADFERWRATDNGALDMRIMALFA
jgi:glycosyltransferase involved in cell wall biosynthesis